MAGLPLQGIRVLTSEMAYAIPYTTRIMASMGAEVIKVMPTKYIEAAVTAGPFPENQPGEEWWNQSLCQTNTNPGKLGICLDLSKPQGAQVFKRLVSISDVVAENWPPRVMKNFRLQYPVLRWVKPDIIMVSSSAFGQSGPFTNYAAYGWGLDAMTGIFHLAGYPDAPPLGQPTPYSDFVGMLTAGIAIMAALEYRRRTGKGQYIDLSQYEAGVSVLGDAILDYIMNGRVQRRIGNQHPSRAPHGFYRCKGDDRWLAIAISSDEEWQALRRAMGDPPWARDERFYDVLGRWRNQDELNKLIESWTKERDAEELTALLQSAGVAAGAMRTSKDMLLSSQMQERSYYELGTSRDPCVGTRPYTGMWQRFSKTPGSIRWAAPLLGEHNERVLGELLGMTRDELDKLVRERVIATAPENPDDYVLARVPLADMQKVGLLRHYDDDYKRIFEERLGWRLG